MWNLEGLKVSGQYLDEFPVFGTVSNSYIDVTGRVVHFVALDEDLELPWTNELRTEVMLNQKQIIKVH